jgi:predicted O-methyltransferase YrrM
MFDQNILGKYLSQKSKSDIGLHTWVLHRLIWNYCEDPLQLVGAEIGVLLGENTHNLLCAFPQLKLHCVDIWDNPLAYELWTKRKNALAILPNREIVEHKCKSTEAKVDDPLDFIWIDADHTEKGCLADLEYWVPKVKEGGVIAGHNIDDECLTDNPPFNRRDVRNAVEKYFGNNFNLAPDYTWWTIK